MVMTPSKMIPLGTDAPSFSLPDTVSGKQISISDYEGAKAIAVMFICNHCPFVKHINEELVKLGNDYVSPEVALIAISSNDAENYPEDAPDKMKQAAEELGYTYPYLYDESQEVAKSYGATCTPDFFVFDSNMKLAYRGQLDDSRPGKQYSSNWRRSPERY